MQNRPVGHKKIPPDKGESRRDTWQYQATAATAAKVSVALKTMTVRVNISIMTWPKRLVASVGVLMFDDFIGVFSEVAQSLCRRRKQLTLRRLRSNREPQFFHSTIR